MTQPHQPDTATSSALEHYRRAQELLHHAGRNLPEFRNNLFAEAQIHATLAVAISTATIAEHLVYPLRSTQADTTQ